jgi:hypothetical protein
MWCDIAVLRILLHRLSVQLSREQIVNFSAQGARIAAPATAPLFAKSELAADRLTSVASRTFMRPFLESQILIPGADPVVWDPKTDRLLMRPGEGVVRANFCPRAELEHFGWFPPRSPSDR